MYNVFVSMLFKPYINSCFCVLTGSYQHKQKIAKLEGKTDSDLNG